MISVRRSEVPAFLQNGVFYMSLNVDDDGEILIPNEYFAIGSTVTDPPGLRSLLSTLRFWGVNSIPNELLRVALNASNVFFKSVAYDFVKELSYLTLLLDIRDAHPDERVVMAASAGSLDILRYLVATKHVFSTLATALAARSGHLDCLRFLHSEGCPWDASTCKSAAKHGHLECLMFAHENNCPWDANTIAEDAARGGLACLRYVCEYDVSLHSSIYNIFAPTDDIESVKFVHKHGVPWSNKFDRYAVFHDSLVSLKYAFENGCVFLDDALHNVRSIECISLIHSTGYVWTVGSSAMVAKLNKVALLRHLRELGCPWDENTCVNAVKNKHHVECLEYAIEHGCAYTMRTVLMAVKCNNMSALSFLHAQGFVFTPEVCAKSVDYYGPGLEMLMFLHTLGCPWDEITTRYAALYGRLDCLKYALERGCAVSPDICYEAGMRGHLDILVYLHTRGCVLMPLSLSEDNEDCVKYVARYRTGHTTCVVQ